MSQKPKVTKFCRAIVLQGNKCNVRKMWSELHPEVVTMFTTAAEYCVATGEGNQEIARRILRLKMVLPELPFNIMGNILEYSHIDNCKNLLRSLTKEQSSVMDWGKLERDLYSPGYPKNEGERTLKAEVYKWRKKHT